MYTSLEGEKDSKKQQNYEVTSKVSSSKIMWSKSDMTSRTAISNISPVLRRRNASKSSPASEGNATLRRLFVKNSLVAVHEFMRLHHFLHGLRLRL